VISAVVVRGRRGAGLAVGSEDTLFEHLLEDRCVAAQLLQQHGLFYG